MSAIAFLGGVKKIDLRKQLSFADLSGDFNPMHVNPEYSRRTIFGGLVVHGMHLTLLALEEFFSLPNAPVDSSITSLAVQYIKPVIVESQIQFYFEGTEEMGYRVIGKVKRSIVIDISFSISKLNFRTLENLKEESTNHYFTSYSFNEMEALKGEVDLFLNGVLADQLFTKLRKVIGGLKLSQLLSLTRIVGMRCPGENSIFGSLTASWRGYEFSDRLEYKVEKVDQRFSLVFINVSGGGMTANVKAFCRPSPSEQLSFSDLTSKISGDFFSSSDALVIGGGRGLGEITAKIIASGGGKVTLTFNSGEADALRVRDEIRLGGGKCEILKLDIQTDLGDLFQRLNHLAFPKSVYYFPSPKIRSSTYFDAELLKEYMDYYVYSFSKILDLFVDRPSASGVTAVFYPSTIFIDTHEKSFAEYVTAKTIGESVCTSYNENFKCLDVLAERLPRLSTDQNLSLTMSDRAQQPFDVLLPLIIEIEKNRIRAT